MLPHPFPLALRADTKLWKSAYLPMLSEVSKGCRGATGASERDKRS